MKILLVEDDEVSRACIREFLEGLGHMVMEGENGHRAFDFCMQEDFDLVITDIKMPIMDGIELLRLIKTLKRNHETEVVVITGHGDMNTAIEALRAGALDYLLKPLDIKELIRITQKIMFNKLEEKLLVSSTIPSKTALTLPIASESTSVKTSEERENERKLLVHSNGLMKLIGLDDIVMLARCGRKSLIYTKEMVVETYEPLHKIEQRMNSPRFFRCHKGYIINVNFVEDIMYWSKNVYQVKLNYVDETAQITPAKLKEYKSRFCL